MAASSSSVIPTPLAHADNQGEGHPGEALLHTNLTRGLAAGRLFRVNPCHAGTIHLQTSMAAPGFEPSPYCTAIFVANH
ncbi:hypothetical protein TNCV_945481 [Trichonephila clavipes]|nr:hypothetical protein TNCV_945481 [Trichonephila clavipes]